MLLVEEENTGCVENGFIFTLLECKKKKVYYIHNYQGVTLLGLIHCYRHFGEMHILSGGLHILLARVEKLDGMLL